VLLFTAYGIGLVRAGRWDILYRLFSYPIEHEGSENKRLVETLFAHAWKGYKHRLFEQLEGLERHHTPLSDRLTIVMEQWKSSFIGVDANFPATFDKFELLASLAYLDRYTEEQLAALIDNQDGHDHLRMPVGRFVWHTSTWRTNKAWLEDPSQARDIYDAGFARGVEWIIRLFIAHVEYLQGRF
jgi:hypothetical protein